MKTPDQTRPDPNALLYTLKKESAAEQNERLRRLRLPRIHSTFLHYLEAALIVCLVALGCYPIAPYFGYQTVSIILLLMVALMPLKFGTGPVLLAAGLSALIWNYYFIPPQFTFFIGLPQDVLMFITYFVIATVTGTLTARIRAREKAVLQREARATALYTLTRDLSNARNQNEVAEASIRNIKKFFHGETSIILSDLTGDIAAKAHASSTYTIDAKEFSVPAWVYWNEKKAGKFTDTLPFAEASYFPISGPRYPLGVIGLKLQQPLSIDQEALLENFISQIASALEREQLNEININSVAVAESEKLYKTLFNSISHELRTPISAIMAASEHLSNSLRPDHSELKHDLAGEIHTAAERLNRLVSNLLDMTRLESGLLKPKLDWCDVSDLIGTTVRKLETELKPRTIDIHVEENMPLVKLDTGLTEQVLTNLLHNAGQYTPGDSQITITARMENRRCLISVSDNGPGIPAEAKDKIFQKFFRASGEKTGGTGLGLSIARGFIEAQGGTLLFRNRDAGGSEFVIALPVDENINVGSS